MTGADADDVEASRRLGGVSGEVYYGETMATGAIAAGRGSFEPAGGWGGDHHDGVPIFVVSRQEPGIDIGQWPLVTYVTDVRAAITHAKEAAGDKNVLVHGAANRAARTRGRRPRRARAPMSARCSSAKGAVSSTTSVPSTSS